MPADDIAPFLIPVVELLKGRTAEEAAKYRSGLQRFLQTHDLSKLLRVSKRLLSEHPAGEDTPRDLAEDIEARDAKRARGLGQTELARTKRAEAERLQRQIEAAETEAAIMEREAQALDDSVARDMELCKQRQELVQTVHILEGVGSAVKK